MIGVTPEAPTSAAAFGGRAPARVIDVTVTDLAAAAAELNSAPAAEVATISIGTPHFSLDEFTTLRALLDGRSVASEIDFFVSTGRGVLAEIEARGWLEDLTRAGVRLVTDTCTYITPILEPRPGAVMTNSAKWAWYAPTNIGKQVVFGSLRECVESAVRGKVWRDESIWHA
jgi:predicted aconitase